VNDSPIAFQTTPLREVNLASIDEDHHVVELRPGFAARRAHVVVDELTGDGSSKVAPFRMNPKRGRWCVALGQGITARTGCLSAQTGCRTSAA
jgi:hypothetical protein